MRSLFRIDLHEQSRNLQEMLTAIVNTLDRFDELKPLLADLGRRHVGSGALPEHYGALQAALLIGAGTYPQHGV